MGQQFLGEIKIVSFGFAPQGWAQCNGQLLPINQNQALFSLLGTMYGGNGQNNFALPDLRGQTPIHQGPQNTIGTKGGEQAHTLAMGEMPSHTHFAQATSVAATAVIPSASLVLGQPPFEIYRPPSSLAPMIAGTVGNVGGGQAHQNMQPFLTLTFCIALQGIFPSRN